MRPCLPAQHRGRGFVFAACKSDLNFPVQYFPQQFQPNPAAQQTFFPVFIELLRPGGEAAVGNSKGPAIVFPNDTELQGLIVPLLGLRYSDRFDFNFRNCRGQMFPDALETKVGARIGVECFQNDFQVLLACFIVC